MIKHLSPRNLDEFKDKEVYVDLGYGYFVAGIYDHFDGNIMIVNTQTHVMFCHVDDVYLSQQAYMRVTKKGRLMSKTLFSKI